MKSLVPLGPRVAPNPRLTTPAVPHLLGQHSLSYRRRKVQGRRWGGELEPQRPPSKHGNTGGEESHRWAHRDPQIRSMRSEETSWKGKSRSSDSVIAELPERTGDLRKEQRWRFLNREALGPGRQHQASDGQEQRGVKRGPDVPPGVLAPQLCHRVPDVQPSWAAAGVLSSKTGI